MSSAAMSDMSVKPGFLRLSAPRPAGDRHRRARASILVLGLALALIAVMSLFVGSVELSPSRILSVLFSQHHDEMMMRDQVVVWQLRLPRALLGILVGGSLALSGAAMQGLFRNPLADPGLVGVSNGAALAAVSVIVLGQWLLGSYAAMLQSYALPLAAFAGGLITTITLYRIATRAGRTSVATMLLAGIALGALSGAMTGLLVFISDDQQLRDLTFWLMGSLGGATWERLAISAPLLIGAGTGILFLARGLNGLVLGEAEAFHLGINVQHLKRLSIVLVAALVGASVAMAGVIGFIGIVVPHLLRLFIGPDHRTLLPASALTGACLLLAADMISRTIVAPAELPIGIVTAALGAPFFLWLLLRQRSVIDL